MAMQLEVKTPSSSTVAQVHQAQLLRPSTWAGARRDGLVAVKIQYPDALARMLQDLVNIRVAARFLQVGTCLLVVSGIFPKQVLGPGQQPRRRALPAGWHPPPAIVSVLGKLSGARV